MDTPKVITFYFAHDFWSCSCVSFYPPAEGLAGNILISCTASSIVGGISLVTRKWHRGVIECELFKGLAQSQ